MYDHNKYKRKVMGRLLDETKIQIAFSVGTNQLFNNKKNLLNG